MNAACTVEALLESLNMKGKPVVVELNGHALAPGEFAHSEITEGDVVEIISIVAGG